MITLYNPTNEQFDMQHQGISFSMKSDEKLEVDDARARHVLNSMGPRGLTSLSYGCDEEKIQKEAIARNLVFKKKQIIEYNQRNENRKMEGKSYLPPTSSVTTYAIELGLKLLEPFTMKDEERSVISSEKKKNVKFENDLKELQKENSELKDMMSQLLEKLSPPPIPEVVEGGGSGKDE